MSRLRGAKLVTGGSFSLQGDTCCSPPCKVSRLAQLFAFPFLLHHYEETGPVSDVLSKLIMLS